MILTIHLTALNAAATNRDILFTKLPQVSTVV